MAKVAINREYGGFCLPVNVARRVAEASPELTDEHESERLGVPVCHPYSSDLRVRSHPVVIEWAEGRLPDSTDGGDATDKTMPKSWTLVGRDTRERLASIEVVNVPDSVALSECLVVNYDGIETVVEMGHFWPDFPA